MRAILARSRQLVAYAIFAAGNKEARDKLAALNRAAQENAMTIEALDAALIEAHKHLTAAQAAVARDVAGCDRPLQSPVGKMTREFLQAYSAETWEAH